MQKILFSLSNVKKIDADVQRVCFIYNQLKDTSLKKITLLDAFSKIYGYSTWAHLKVVNKDDRHYVSFSFSVSSHVRTIISKLNELTKIDPQMLLVSVTLLELGVNSIEHIYLVDCDNNQYLKVFQGNIKIVNSASNMLWFTDNLSRPERHLSCDAMAARVIRKGIIVSDFIELFPELGSLMKTKFKLNDEFVLLFNFPTWGYYNDNFTRSKLLTAKFEIHVRQNGLLRVCYHPFYCDDMSNLFPEMLTAFVDGMPYCPKINDIDDNLSDYDYVMMCWKKWEQQEHIEKIILTLKPSDSMLYEHMLSHDKLEILDFNIDKHFERITRSDFTNLIYSWEPRLKYVGNNIEIEHEKWVNKSDIETFVKVNARIHENLKQLTKSVAMFPIAKRINAYYSQKFAL